MVGVILTELAIILVLMIANGIFAAAELALVSARHSQLEQAAKAGDRRAERALHMAREPNRLLATVQVGITLIGTFAAAFGGARLSRPIAELLADIPLLAPYAEQVALICVVLLITYLSLIVGELVPKQLALLHAEKTAILFAPLLGNIAVVTRPIVWMLTHSTNVVLALLGQRAEPEERITEEDILYMTRQGRAGGTVALHEERLIQRVFDFSDRTVEMIMTPRPDITFVSDTTSIPQLAAIALEHGYSRLPVCHDHDLDQVLGVVHIKDVLPTLVHQQEQNLLQVLRPPVYVLEHQRVSTVLAYFRREQVQMGLVVDEYGQIVGLITLEDVLEELVGEIRDEYDTDEEASMVEREDGSWLVDGSEAFDIVATRLGLPINTDTSDDYVTLAGFVLAALGRLAQVGDTITAGDWQIEVVDLDGRRVDKLLLRRSDADPAV